LGLKKTSCYTDKASSRAVSGYDSRFTPLARFGIKKEISRFQIPFKSFTFASGHIESNASDISTFYYSLYNGRILDKKSISIITKFIDADYKYPPQMTGYGLGVMRFSVDNIELWGNVGMMLGFSGVSVYSPERGYFITILANVPEVEKLFNGVAFLQKHLIERILENNRY
jgi:CubicO group peptidase (beta-lactamase class C family)